METIKPRENWIDNAKGIAMILIMIGHLGFNVAYKQWSLGFVNGFHLAVFYFISGYTTKKTPLNKAFISKKFNRLMIPYFAACTGIILMSAINEIILNHDASILTTTQAIGRNILSSFYASGYTTNYMGVETGIRIGAIWFLPAMFFSIIFFQIILNKCNTTLARVLISVAIGLVGYFSAKYIWLPFSIQSGMLATPFICAGYEIKEHKLLEKIKWWHYVIAAVLLIEGMYFDFCAVYFSTATMKNLIFSPIIAFAGSLLVYLLAKHVDKIKIIGYIGRISIYVLCAHIILLESCSQYFQNLAEWAVKDGTNHLIVSGLRFLISAGLQFVLSIAFGILIDYLAKKHKVFKETYMQRKLEKQQEGIGQNKKPRDLSLDVLRGLFIISMIVGHYCIGDSLIKIIYSCHMAAFVVVSGYFFSKEKSLKDTLKSSAKTLLLPYAAFAIVQILINIPNWSGQFFLEALKKYFSGVILTKDILTNVQSIGPAWFILMLFVVRILYTLIQKICKKEWIVTIVVVVLSIGGVVIGKAGYWLPWSFDIALYSLIFYHAGHLFKKFKVLEYVKEHLVLYFVLTPIWAYMIYKGSVELSRRNYGAYGLGIIGALAGILTTYMLCTLLVDGCPAISNFLALLGKASMYILLVHTLLDEILRVALIKILPQGNIIIMIIAMAAELIASLIIFKLKTKCDKI